MNLIIYFLMGLALGLFMDIITRIMKLSRCSIRWHKWIYLIPTEPRERRCERCGKQQYLLPGYGGQEPWCWLNKK